MSQRVGDWILLEEVGRGTHATVHRARRADRSGHVVAVKRLRADAPDEVLARLQREAEVLAELRHPAIQVLLDVVAGPDGDVSLVSPWAPGGTLEDVLAGTGALPWPQVADLGARLASALSAAHGAGVLHRDVKPANVLLGAEDEPRLADFGTVALVEGGRLVDDGVVVGTAEYVDPAVVLDGAPPSPRSDQYGLGVVLYRALSGQLPYAAGGPDATVQAAGRGVHAPLGQLCPEVPTDVVEAVERAMARRPEDRFANVQQLQTILESRARDDDNRRLASLAAEFEGTAPSASEGSGDEEPADPGPDADPPPAPLTDSGTRLFGPRPTVAASSGARGPRPAWAVPALVGVVAVVAVAAGVVLLGEDGDGPAPAPDPTPQARQPVERCADAPEPSGDGEVLLADVDARGCSLPLTLAQEEVDGEPQQVLTLPAEAGELAGRYALAPPDDVVVVGDWDGDGSETPGVYRPADGRVYLFDGYGGLEPEEGPRLEPGVAVRVVAGEDGDEVVVADDRDAALA